MIISNCWSAGADSHANPVTGVVTRRDSTTGQEVAASIRPNGSAPDNGRPVPAVDGATLAPAALSVLLGTQEA